MFIVFVGVDGSGKSSIINNIELENKIIFHFCPVSRYNKSKTIVSNPHNQKLYSEWLSGIKVFLLFILFWFGYLKNIYLKKKSNLIIGDRYIYDIYFDPIRYRLKINKNILSKILHLFPKPDFVFCCYGSPDEIYKRKPELSLKVIKQQQNIIKLFASEKDNWVGLNTTDFDLNEVSRKVLKYII